MYAKQTQTDTVSVGEKVSDDEEEGENSRDLSSKESQRSETNPNMDDTIEPEKQVSPRLP